MLIELSENICGEPAVLKNTYYMQSSELGVTRIFKR